MASKLLTAEEVMAATQMSRSHIYRELRSGRLASFKLGRILRISEDAVAEWLAAQVVTA